MELVFGGVRSRCCSPRNFPKLLRGKMHGLGGLLLRLRLWLAVGLVGSIVGHDRLLRNCWSVSSLDYYGTPSLNLTPKFGISRVVRSGTRLFSMRLHLLGEAISLRLAEWTGRKRSIEE